MAPTPTPIPHVLLVAATTGYQTERFREAAAALDARVTLATDRCDQLPNPWGDDAVPVRFEDPKAAIIALKPRGPFQGVVALGDRAAVLAAQVAAKLGIPFHPPDAAAICHDKFAFKQVLHDAGLPVPWFERFPVSADPAAAAQKVQFPCVLKPVMLSASRGVIRANDAAEFAAAFTRIRSLLATPAIQQWKEPNAQWILAEGYFPGAEYALEGWISTGTVQRFALFDKPDPLAGPFFEETTYTTPSQLDTEHRALIWDMVEAAARAVGLGPGPIHAEIRLDGDNAYVLEIACRPIGGLCARTLRFRRDGAKETIPLEQLILRGALGQPLAGWEREPAATGVMMIPIPSGGVFDSVTGVPDARAVPGIESVDITAKPGEPLVALPEGSSYLGFLFARAATAPAVAAALRSAHAQLHIRMREALPVT